MTYRRETWAHLLLVACIATPPTQCTSLILCKDRSSFLPEWREEVSTLPNRMVESDAWEEFQRLGRRETPDISERLRQIGWRRRHSAGALEWPVGEPQEQSPSARRHLLQLVFSTLVFNEGTPAEVSSRLPGDVSSWSSRFPARLSRALRLHWHLFAAAMLPTSFERQGGISRPPAALPDDQRPPPQKCDTHENRGDEDDVPHLAHGALDPFHRVP